MLLDPLSMLEEEEDPDFSAEFQETIERADSGTLWAFIAAVLLAQAGLFAVSLGAMLIWFRNQWTLGGGLVGGGGVALALTVGIYWWHRTRSTGVS